MTTRKLNAKDFMMMDVHRPMTDEEIAAIHPQALVDKSARTLKIVDSEAEGVGAPHEEEQAEERGYQGPFITYPDNVAVVDVATSHELDVNRVLQAAYDSNLIMVMVVGTHDDGELYVLCSEPDVAETNLLCDRAKMFLLQAIANRETGADPRGPKRA